MAYRRRRRTAPRRRTVWTRQVALKDTAGPEWEAGQEVWVMDCLGKVRTQQGTPAVLDSTSRAASAVQGITFPGCTIQRVFLDVTLHFQNDVGAVDPNDGAFVGMYVGPYGLDAYNSWVEAGADADDTGMFPYDPRFSADQTDWMHWQWLSAFDNAVYTTITPIQSIVSHHTYVVKSRRKLEDIGDTLVFCMRAGPQGTGPRSFNVATSVLVAT